MHKQHPVTMRSCHAVLCGAAQTRSAPINTGEPSVLFAHAIRTDVLSDQCDHWSSVVILDYHSSPEDNNVVNSINMN